ncbi:MULTISPECIES: copper homeostasis protein CutC [Arthrobacter]|uniref:PF03932 family protein CutC n=1 Tax=Arthrobacter psychrochitiniphilus TaxID=291045 RepID=A0A2V3DSQ8_9MICC|nr:MULTISPECIES: copper homeostasis protein CutC [Arthrobacter]NYG17634.1 copper homeostasis protein [Arthrobacter psychrochitiniphilus]PXA65296.1 copper homeostasis protein CutC [Arthrobacter psychrochitiniphilus]
MQLEIAVQDVPGAQLAAAHGAARIELCCALQLGGLTPSQGLLQSVRSAEPALPIHALIRPRPGDYVYDEAAVALMVAEIKAMRDGGATGVVIGALTAADTIDYQSVQTLVAAADGLHITFHRAVDHLSLSDAVAAVPHLADLGVCRILSSGGAASAGTGLEQLQAMHEASAGALSIMAGGGVKISDFAAFYDAGLRDVHLSAKRTLNTRPPGHLTGAALAEDHSYFATDAALVEQAGQAARALH